MKDTAHLRPGCPSEPRRPRPWPGQRWASLEATTGMHSPRDTKETPSAPAGTQLSTGSGGQSAGATGCPEAAGCSLPARHAPGPVAARKTGTLETNSKVVLLVFLGGESECPPQVSSHQGAAKGHYPFWRQTARGARATGSATLPAPTAAARLTAPPRACAPGCQQQPPATRRGSDPPPQHRPLPVPESAVPLPSHDTYRLRTSSGREMAGVASVGTRAGAVRAGISEATADATAAQEAPAFRAETNWEGQRAEAARTTLARARGKAGRTMQREKRTTCGQSVERAVRMSCACARRASAPPGAEQWARPSPANAVC
jgi:hypothetical protein